MASLPPLGALRSLSLAANELTDVAALGSLLVARCAALEQLAVGGNPFCFAADNAGEFAFAQQAAVAERLRRLVPSLKSIESGSLF